MASSDFQATFGDPFRVVFAVTFVLTFLVFPLVMAEQGGDPLGDNAGAIFLLSWLIGALAFAVPLLFKSLVVAPIVFACVVWLGRIALPDFLTFGCAVAASAFAACFIGMRLNIDIFPPGLSWKPERDRFGVPMGTTAAIIAVLVAVPVWLGREQGIS